MNIRLKMRPELFDVIRKHFHEGTTIDVTLHSMQFKAYVESFRVESGTAYLDVNLRITGEVLDVRTQDSVQEKKMSPKAKVKFYVGKSDVCTGNDYPQWGKGSLAEAVEHAKELCEKDGNDHYVVKVVKVVRRKPQPIIVEDVK